MNAMNEGMALAKLAFDRWLELQLRGRHATPLDAPLPAALQELIDEPGCR